MKRIELINVYEEYVDYLYEFDNKVLHNQIHENSRPSIGFLLDVDDYKMVIPLTSPKPKHENSAFRRKKDIYLIDDGSKGVLQINNMIPIIDQYEVIDLETHSNKELLELQFIDVVENKKIIKERAETLLELNRTKPNNRKLRNCCDFKLLKEKCNDYVKMKEEELRR